MATFKIPSLGPKQTNGKRKSFTPKAEVDLLGVDVKGTDNILSARFACVAEAPSVVEMAEGQPLVGPAGNQFDRICSAIGLPRYKLFLTNFCKTMLPKNNTDVLWTAKGYRHPQWGQLQQNLLEELAVFPGKIIILLGETAMRAVLDHPKFDSITKYRGSIYRADDFPHLKPYLSGKYIAITQHPASSLARRNPMNFYIIMNDMQKFIELDKNPSLLDPPVTLHTQPTHSQAIEFLNEVNLQSETAYDIEATPRQITCFAFSLKPNEAMSIPLINNKGNYWMPQEEMELWQMAAKILGNPSCKKIMQNGMFDIMFTLRTMGIITDNFWFDTMLAQHVCWTDLPKGLDFLTSVYTYHPYYKDDGKQSHLKLIKDWPNYWQYNARDACYTHELKNPLIEELISFGAESFFHHLMDFHKPLMEMEWNGLLLDVKGIAKEKAKLEKRMLALQHGINKLAQRDLNINSSKQMIEYFYNDCKLRPFVNRKTGNPSCDAVALSRIARKGKIPGAVARLATRKRGAGKLVSTYFNVNYDSDNKLRCSHKISGTESGRISTEKTFFGTGANLQNQPPAFKKYLIAEPGKLLCEFDLAKAEAHVVAYICQDANMMEAFESGVDVHSFNASKIFDIPLEEVTKPQRNMGKRVVHASNYGMGPQTFSDNLAKDDIFMSQRECRTLLQAYARRFPGLHRWHKEIDQEIYSTRTLYDLFGKPKRFLGNIDSHLLRTGYSYKPQSTVARLLNNGTVKIANDPDLDFIDLNTTVHDSDVISFPASMSAQDILDMLLRFQQHLHHVFTYKGRSFVIGVDAKIGTAWAGNTAEIKEFKLDQVEAALETIQRNNR